MGGRGFAAAQHAGDFLHACGIVEFADPGKRATVHDVLGDAEMGVGADGDLRQM